MGNSHLGAEVRELSEEFRMGVVSVGLVGPLTLKPKP